MERRIGMKKKVIIIATFALTIIAISVAEFVFFKSRVASEVQTAKLEYEKAIESYNNAKEKYDSAYSDVMDYRKSLEDSVENVNAKIENLTSSLNDATTELNTLNEASVLAEKAEKERYEALSDEEKEYEKHAKEYNQMIGYLRENNPDYNALYIKVFNYLDADIGKMSSAQIKTFYDLLQEKHRYEQEYKKNVSNSDSE